MPSSPSQNPDHPSILLKILGAAFLAFSLVRLFSKLRTSIEQSIESDCTEDNAHNERSSRQCVSPSPARVIVERLPPPETPKEEWKAEKKRDRRPQWGIVVVNVLTLAAVIVYAIFTWKMWREMQNQTRIQRETGINTERAWVGLDVPVKIDVLETTPRLKVESHYSIRNFGHGPALKVVTTGFFWIDGKVLGNLAKSACDMSTHFATGTVPLGPGLVSPGPMGYTLFPNQPHDETIGSPTDPWQGDAQSDLKHFWFIGCTSYIDQFKTARWTRFCMEPDIFARHPMNKDIPLKFCALYNDTSDTEETKQN